MTTIVNTPPSQPVNDSSNSAGWLITALVVIALFFLLLYFGIPMLRRASTPAQINVPDKVDVNINTPNSP